jgi:pyrroline-5-carboxylate reductase
MEHKLAVIGVGNMAKAIIAGIASSKLPVSEFLLYDKNPEAFSNLPICEGFRRTDSISDAITEADCVLLSVKPQNYPEVLSEIAELDGHSKKLYISIAAGITSDSVSEALDGAVVIRVLPNIPMTIGCGVSAICRNSAASEESFSFVTDIFASAGSTLIIDECEMNRIIGVTSSSPAYVFKFIDAICKGAELQGLDRDALLSAVCDVVIGSAMLLKNSPDAPSLLISRVASKGGTTERALSALDEADFDNMIAQAMIACTKRADELGGK